MGSDAEVFVFDYDAYRSKVIPAVRRILNEGVIEPWLVEADRRSFYGLGEQSELGGIRRLGSTDLATNCTYLSADLAHEAEPDPAAFWMMPWENAGLTYEEYESEVDAGRDPRERLGYPEREWYVDWDHRACRSETCPDRRFCPFHKLKSSREVVEDLLYLVHLAISVACLGRGLFVGRTSKIGDYRQTLIDLGAWERGDLRRLLEKLGHRGFVIGYDFGGSCEGVHGWLTPDETGQLLSELKAIDLPDFPATFDALDSFFRDKEEPDGYAAPSGFTWEQLALALVRTVAQRAAIERTGEEKQSR